MYTYEATSLSRGTMATPKGPFKLMSVNKSPERSRRLIGQAAEALKDRYIILHEANCQSRSTPNAIAAAED